MDLLSAAVGHLRSCFSSIGRWFQETLGFGDGGNVGGGGDGGGGQYQNPVFPEDYVAKYPWVANSNAELSVEKGDQCEVLESFGEYLYVRLKRKPLSASQRREGFVPSRCLVSKTSLESKPWFLGSMSRQDAEQLLLQEGNPAGCFLVRERKEKRPQGEETHPLALSVLHAGQVIHYKIHHDTKGRAFFTEQETFSGVMPLIEACRRSAHGLCCKLSEPPTSPLHPLPPTFPNPPPYDLLEAEELNPSELLLLREVGRGRFGSVYEGRLRGLLPVAVKRLHDSNMDREAFLREAALLKRLVHDNVVRFYGVCTQNGAPLIITELMSMSLLQFLKVRGLDLSLADMVLGCRQVASGLEFLSSQNIVHRDIAARNILVGSGDSGVWKIADLGIARILSEDLYVARPGVCVPVKWTSPEALDEGIFSSASDVWSFGILVVEVMTGGEEPYAGMTNAEVRSALSQGFRLPCPPTFQHPDLWAVASACWAEIPEDRPSCTQLYSLLYALIDDWADEFD